jgi:hypothetical protein
VFNSSHKIDILYITSIIQESENYYLKKENEAMQSMLNYLTVSFNYEHLSQNNELLQSYTTLPTNKILRVCIIY